VVRLKVHFHDVIGDQSWRPAEVRAAGRGGGALVGRLGAAPAGRGGSTTRAWPHAAGRAAYGGPFRAAGSRHPVASSRELAGDLGVSRGLVTEAYEQLTAEGYLRSGRGAGTWVGGAVRAVGPRARDHSPRPVGVRADFVAGTPDLSLFPRTVWAAAHRGVLAELPHQALGYPDPRGLPRLRTALAELLVRRRGVARTRNASSWSPGSRRR
jgi:Transcriptional regulators containing a DNA-binding HTH domain and an aminotransferase domain (MocR family) and their eukaryotic orthologs